MDNGAGKGGRSVMGIARDGIGTGATVEQSENPIQEGRNLGPKKDGNDGLIAIATLARRTKNLVEGDIYKAPGVNKDKELWMR